MVNFWPFQAGSGLPLSAASKAARAVLASDSTAVGKPLIIAWAGADVGVGVTTTSLTCGVPATTTVSLTVSLTTWVTTFSTSLVTTFSTTWGVGAGPQALNMVVITMIAIATEKKRFILVLL